MRRFTVFMTIMLMFSLMFMTSCQTVQPRSAIAEYDYSEMRLVQLETMLSKNQENRPVAVITTTLGVIRIALFPEYAPNTVANFIDRINEGFYDDSPVLAIQEGVFFQAGVNSDGEAKTTDNEGESLVIENEYSVNMWPFKGAVGSYGNTPGISDSRFFIIDEQYLTEEEWEQLREMPIDGENPLPDELLNAFEEIGGAITLSGFFTIFGQTIEGIEVVETIAATEVDRISRPVEEIRIITIELE